MAPKYIINLKWQLNLKIKYFEFLYFKKRMVYYFGYYFICY